MLRRTSKQIHVLYVWICMYPSISTPINRTHTYSSISSYCQYIANSASRQHNQILLCDWLPEWASRGHLSLWGIPATSRKKTVYFTLCTKCLIGRSTWLDIFLVGNIAPSSPAPWSIIHIFSGIYRYSSEILEGSPYP